MDFLSASRRTMNDLNKMHNLNQDLNKRMKIKQNSVLSDEQNNLLDSKIDATILTINSLGEDIKEWIYSSKQETEKLKKEEVNKHIIDLRENHILNSSNKLSEELKLFTSVQCEFKQKEKKIIYETYLIACPDATEEELKSLNDPEKAEMVLESAFALGSNSAKSILNEAKNRKRKIDLIVARVKNLVSLIKEIDNIVSSGNPAVDQLVITMDKAEQNTKSSVQELTQAREYQDSANYYKRIFAFIFGFFIILLFLYVGKLIREFYS